MKVLVTGATGGLGRNLVEALLRDGHTVCATGRRRDVGSILEALGASFFEADISQDDCFRGLDFGAEVVVHCAALSSPWGSYDAFYSANVRGTQQVGEWALRSRVRRFVHISTPALYVNGNDRLNVREDEVLHHQWANHYVATKYCAEQEVGRLVGEGLAAVILRPRAIFGPHDKVLMPRLLTMFRLGYFPLIEGGRALMDVTYVGNVVKAISQIIDANEQVVGKAYNITNGQPITFSQLIQKVAGVLELKVKPISLPYRVMWCLAGASEFFCRQFRIPSEPRLTRYAVQLLGRSLTLDISAAESDWGFVPEISIDDGLKRYAQWRLATLER